MGISIAQLRNLDTTRLQDAADAAVIVGKNLADHAGAIIDAAGQSFAIWIDADAQNALLQTFPPPLDAASTAFKSSAGTIDTLIGELDRAKAELETAIASHPEFNVGPDGGFTYPAGMETRVQSLIDGMNAACAAADTADAVSALAKHNTAPKPAPATLDTGDDIDNVKIHTDDKGKIYINVDGQKYEYEPGTELTVNTGGGNDDIVIDEHIDPDADITVNAGAGADKIQGSAAADKLDGDGGRDVLSGGRDNDRLRGGDDDTLYAGGGTDELDGGTGADKNFVQPEDTVTPDATDTVQQVEVKDTDFITVNGDPESRTASAPISTCTAPLPPVTP